MVVKLYQDPVYERQVVHSFESESHPLSIKRTL
jgi:hypothetical protein